MMRRALATSAAAKVAAALCAVIALASCATTSQVPTAVRSDLAPSGTLRAGINLGNGVIAARDPASGEPRGIAPNLARELGRRLGVPVQFVVFDQARLMMDGMNKGECDVAFLAIDPLRAETADFTPPYAEIAGTYLVPPGSAIKSIAEVDRKGVRVSTVARSNYDLFLTRSLKNATLVRADTTAGSNDAFVAGQVDVLAGVKQRVEDASKRVPGSRVLGQFMSIRQAIAVPKGRAAGFQYAREFVEDVKASGFVAREVAKAGVGDATVSAPERVR